MGKAKEDQSWRPEWFTDEQIDTVIVAFIDVYGRLLGKRMTRDHFVNQVKDAGMNACSYLMTTDIDMNTREGFRLTGWDTGYGDFHIQADLQTLRRLPWLPGTAIVLGDMFHENGQPVKESPRQVLRKQLQRLADAGRKAYIASELEFHLFDEDYRSITKKDFRNLSSSSDYLIDYHILQPGRDEDFLRRLRNEMTEAGITIECSKGECGMGQHEVNMVYTRALEMADRHVLYKSGAKDIAAQLGKAITFMAKWATGQAGSSFHLHISLWDADEKHNLFYDPQSDGPSELFRQFLGGLLKYSRELSYFSAPTVNSYKRYRHGSWAPTVIVCGKDNRSCGLRLVGEGDSLRIENRMPGADANPYLAFAANLAAGLQGIEEKLDCGAIYEGNAYEDDSLARLPESLTEAVDLLQNSEIARLAFGSDVIDFYVHSARLEAQAFRQSVTDWEQRRYFEQI